MSKNSVVFVIVDKTDRNYHKRFISIHHDEQKAKEEVEELRSQVSGDYAKNLISYETVICKS